MEGRGVTKERDMLWTTGKPYRRGDVVYATVTKNPGLFTRLWCWLTRRPLPTASGTVTVVYECIEGHEGA